MTRRCSTRRVLILMAHTGGGHLRAAEAVAEALKQRHRDAVSVQTIDAVGEYAPFPFNRLGDLYPYWIDRAPATWEWGYRLTDGRRRAKGLLRLFWPLVWPRMWCLLNRYPADAVVSLHPLTNHYTAWALRRMGRAVSVLTLVTDPVSVHPFWLSPQVQRCLVGGPEAQRKALEYGFQEDQVHVTGLPVNPRFVEGLIERAQARRVLGWDPVRMAVLVAGGSDGMGRLYETARAIDALCTDIQLVVLTGRNRRLLQRLLEADWRLPVRFYGCVHHTREMPCLMSAADLLITKAGPGTLHEAFLAGLPMILNGAVPGQEEGNVRLVVKGGAGVWERDPRQVAALVAGWMGVDRNRLERLAVHSRALARPDAAVVVADHVWQLTLTNL